MTTANKNPTNFGRGSVKKTTFRIHVWDFVNIGAINDALDDARASQKKRGIAADISYRCKSITPDGDIVLTATHLVEKY